MSKFMKSSVLAISFLMVTVIVAGCSSGSVSQEKEGTFSSGSTNGLVQSSIGGSVTIDVEWGKKENGLLTFYVSMNTHSVDLDQYDLGALVVLRDDAGNEYRPVSWDAAAGGHHREGTLIFPIPDSLSQGEAKYLELAIRDVAGLKERVLKWEL